MAGKQISGDGLSANVAGMSKYQLYDIMCQMKSLIDQNQQQARQILTQNPLLTKGIFQAQIMLGMVKPPQAAPNIQPQVPQNPQQVVQPVQQSNAQPAPTMPGQVGIQSSAAASLVKQHQNQPSVTTSSSTAPAVSYQSQALSTHPPQRLVRPLHPPERPMSFQDSSHLSTLAPPHSSQSLYEVQKLAASGQSQQSLQSGAFPHLPLQQPSQQVRPSPTPAFRSQYPPKMVPNIGSQQSVFHPDKRGPAGAGPTVPQGEGSALNLPPAQRPYQGGPSHSATRFSHQVGNPVQIDRGSSFMPSSEHSTITSHPAQQSVVPGQNAATNRPSGGALALSPEMERQLLQQVMSLTPEQINLLPPEQRNQVLHLQKMLRQ